MRALALALLAAACTPSVTVQNTMPVANMQSYRTVALRVHSSAFAAQGIAMYMEQAVTRKLQEKCAFQVVGAEGGAQPADLVLDLNVTNHARGGTGWIRNENQVSIDTLLVLSDGVDGDLLGTSKIQGKSSGTVVNNEPQDNEAIEIIAKTVADVLWKSGCAGPRVARAPAPPPPGPTTVTQGSGATQGSGGPATPDESRRAEAEALNDKGKERLFNADTQGALGLFQQANSTLPDPKYQFNVCVALGAAERWDEALAACQQARAMNPPEKLAGKIDQRMVGLKQHQ